MSSIFCSLDSLFICASLLRAIESVEQRFDIEQFHWSPGPRVLRSGPAAVMFLDALLYVAGRACVVSLVGEFYNVDINASGPRLLLLLRADPT